MTTIGSIQDNLVPQPSSSGPVAKAKSDFGDMLQSMTSSVNETQLDAEGAISDLQSGKAQHLHEVMIAVEKADVSLRMLVQIRNRAVTAYEEIMRMQI